MILDDLVHASTYFDLHPRLRIALEWLQAIDPATLTPGRHEIDGDEVFASVTDYDTRPASATRWEAHRRHADVQCVLTGEERIGVTPLRTLQADPYDDDRDILFADGDGPFVALTPGRFVVLFPQDAHMPGVVVDAAAPVRKLVIKLRIDDDATSWVPPVIP